MGFNEPKPPVRTGLLSVDLSKAFDVVDHHKLIKKVSETNLHPNLKRWLIAYMRDRKVRHLSLEEGEEGRSPGRGLISGAVQLLRQGSQVIRAIEQRVC